jgi:sugar lactone lactonase YvrE
MNRYFLIALVLFALISAVPVVGVIPQFWEVRTYGEFSEGELENLSLAADGRLVPAPGFDLIFDTGEPLIVSAVADSTGRVYLGTGHEGKVFAVDSNGNGGLFAELDELDVLAMVVDDDDNLFAATSPDGRVYRIADDGTPEVFFDPDGLYIWAMVFDSEGRLLVATGDEGIIYRVDQDGDSEILYDSEETHIISLAIDGDGNVIAGGDPKGYLYRISEDGSVFVLHDSGMREVHSVVVAGDGTIYAAVLNPENSAQSSGALTGASGVTVVGAPISISIANSTPVAASPQALVVADASSSTGAENGDAFGGEGASGSVRSRILEIAPNGSVNSVWESSDQMVFSLLSQAEGLLFATGTRGRVYEYDGAQRATLLTESTEEQTTHLFGVTGRIFAASSNSGKLFELGDQAGDAGSYTSVVRDTSSVSSWGKLTWTGNRVQVRTRTGNTGSPDPTWSDWTSVTEDGQVLSPRARFVQWSAELDGSPDDSPELSSVTMAYLQQNFRPEVDSVDVLKPGVALRPAQAAAGIANGANNNNRGRISGRVEPVTTTPQPRSVLERGVQALRWSAEDDNDDVLVYSVLYRAENENDWKVLVEGLGETFYTIAPDTLPDGMYVMRVIASDVGSNPVDLALDGELETRPFSIDNTPPAVAVRQGDIEDGRARLAVTTVDQTSILKQAEVSIDAGPWSPVFPVDGVVDSLSEAFDFLSAPLAVGEHVVSVRIYDQNDNVGIGSTIVRIPQ